MNLINLFSSIKSAIFSNKTKANLEQTQASKTNLCSDTFEKYSPNLYWDEETTTICYHNYKYHMIKVEGGHVRAIIEDSEPDILKRKIDTLDNKIDDFFIGELLVPQSLWESVMNSNPCRWKGKNLPVESVTWFMCQEFIDKLNALTGMEFRFPTESEWIYAAQGGNKSLKYLFSGSNNIDDVAWHSGNSAHMTHEVGTKKPNELGIFDMSGNVWEWCADFYNIEDSIVPNQQLIMQSGVERILHGGSWYRSSSSCQLSCRSHNVPDDQSGGIGLRLCMSL